MPRGDGTYAKKRIDGHRERVSHLVVFEETGRAVSHDLDEVVHHLNGDISDNGIENLRVMTRSEHGRLHNPRDGSRFGVSAADNKKLWSKRYRRETADAEGIPLRVYKVTKHVYDSINDLLSQGISQAVIAKRHGLNPSTISRIKHGKRLRRYANQ